MGVETRRVAAGNRQKKAAPPILSHEFVIQNHGDIMSCIIMVVIVGLMFPTSTALSAVFVAPQYNETMTANGSEGPITYAVYTNGVRDLCTVAFYTVAWIVGHAVIQEYILDKLQRKVHLSKSKTFKFTESGHQIFFSLYSIAHIVYIFMEFAQNEAVTYANAHLLLHKGYPNDHRYMSLNVKMFFILQLAYWFHQYPEFYFQKYKRDELKQKAFVSFLFILFTGGAYVMNFQRLALAILFLEYVSQAVFHIARLSYFLERKSIARPAFTAYDVTFIVTRLGCIALAAYTFWFGLRESESPNIDFSLGNYNTNYVRVNCLLCVITLQVYQIYLFQSAHNARKSESNKKKEKKSAPPPKPAKKVRNDDSESESQSDSRGSKKRN